MRWLWQQILLSFIWNPGLYLEILFFFNGFWLNLMLPVICVFHGECYNLMIRVFIRHGTAKRNTSFLVKEDWEIQCRQFRVSWMKAKSDKFMTQWTKHDWDEQIKIAHMSLLVKTLIINAGASYKVRDPPGSQWDSRNCVWFPVSKHVIIHSCRGRVCSP
jgi:hypothetical protein